MRLVLAALMLVSATAHANKGWFARWHNVDQAKVKEVRSFTLTGGDFTDVMIGRFPDGQYTMAGVVIARCNAARDQCPGRRVNFGASEKIDVLGVVDLEGEPAALPTRARPDRDKLSARGKFPVLVVQTEERTTVTGGEGKSGTRQSTRLHLISLVETDRGSVVMHDTSYQNGPTYHGWKRSYRLDRPLLVDKDRPEEPGDAGKPRDPAAPRDPKGKLELVVVEQRHDKSRCAKPEPTEYVYRLDGRHFRNHELVAPRRACR